MRARRGVRDASHRHTFAHSGPRCPARLHPSAPRLRQRRLLLVARRPVDQGAAALSSGKAGEQGRHRAADQLRPHRQGRRLLRPVHAQRSAALFPGLVGAGALVRGRSLRARHVDLAQRLHPGPRPGLGHGCRRGREAGPCRLGAAAGDARRGRRGGAGLGSAGRLSRRDGGRRGGRHVGRAGPDRLASIRPRRPSGLARSGGRVAGGRGLPKTSCPVPRPDSPRIRTDVYPPFLRAVREEPPRPGREDAQLLLLRRARLPPAGDDLERPSGGGVQGPQRLRPPARAGRAVRRRRAGARRSCGWTTTMSAWPWPRRASSSPSSIGIRIAA